MSDVKRRTVADLPQQLDRCCGFKPIAILHGNVAGEIVLVVFKMKTCDAERVDVAVYDLRPADGAHNQVSSGVVAERDRETQEFAQRKVNPGLRIFILQRTMGMRKDAIAGEKADGLVERKFALFDEIQSGDGERKFEDRLHRRMGVGIEVAVQRRVRQRAGYGNFALGVSGYHANLLLQGGLGISKKGDNEKR